MDTRLVGLVCNDGAGSGRIRDVLEHSSDPSLNGLRVIGSRPQREPIYFSFPPIPAFTTNAGAARIDGYFRVAKNFLLSALE